MGPRRREPQTGATRHCAGEEDAARSFPWSKEIMKTMALMIRVGSAGAGRAVGASCLGLAVLASSGVAMAKMYEAPRSFSLTDKSQDQVDRKILPKLDIDKLVADAVARGKDPTRPQPRRFAVAADVAYTMENSGTWRTLPDGRLWRLRIQSPGAHS